MRSSGETVAVTGFGPFGGHLVNLSWTVAQALKAEGLEDGIEIYIKEIPVSYCRAKEILEGIWEEVQPEFAVHLGIYSGAKAITLEQTGKNQGYEHTDVCGQCPASNCCVDGGTDKLHSIVNMKALTKKLKATGVDVIYSKDAGRYLCDFSYYYSLHRGKGRAAFIHLPTKGPQAAPEKLVAQLRIIILGMLSEARGLSEDDTQASSTSSADRSPAQECTQQIIQPVQCSAL